MIISAHQPAYLPWIGYFGKIARSDAFVLHDRSRIGHGNMLHRNKIDTTAGPMLLTVPLSRADVRAELPLDEIRLVEDGWRRRHWKAIQMAYRRAPYFDRYAEFLASYYAGSYKTLDELCRPFIDYCLRELGLTTSMHTVSQLDLPAVDRDTIIPALCEAFGAARFLAGPLSVGYLDLDALAERGIQIEVFEFVHPRYGQRHPDFRSHLSVLDLLMNCGPASGDIVREESR